MAKNPPANAGDAWFKFNPWVRKIPWRRKWQPTPVFLLGKSYGQRSLVGYSPWGRKRVEHDLMTEQQQIPYMLLFSVCCPCSLFLFLSSQIFLPFVALVEYFI